MQLLLSGGNHKNTSCLAESQRFDYWRDAICDEFVNLDCEPVNNTAFSGELNGGVGVSDLRFSEVLSDAQVVHRSKRQIAKSTEADFLISFQLEKRCLVRQDGREALLSPGSFALYDSTRPYSLSFQERFHQFVIQMPSDVLSRHLMNPEDYTAIPISGSSGLGAILTNFVFSLAKELNELQQAPDELSENLVNMIAMAFSSSVMLNQSSGNSVVQDSLRRRIKQYIDNNLCNPDLNNKHIAQSQGISLRYLHKVFQQEQESIHAVILEKRLRRAYDLLTDKNYTGYTVEKIAYSLGFSSAAHFSKTFKKRFEVSPSTARHCI